MREESENLVKQAEEDLVTARVLLEGDRFYASAFFSQQTAEKALKALYQEIHRRPIFTHDLTRIAGQLDAPDEIRTAAAELTPDYVVTRYPNAVGGVPAQLYSRGKAQRQVEFSRSIMSWVRQRLQDL